MTSSDLKKLIESEARKRKWSPATLCKMAVGNNRLHRTLSNGGSCTLDVLERFQKYLVAHPPQEPAQ